MDAEAAESVAVAAVRARAWALYAAPGWLSLPLRALIPEAGASDAPSPDGRAG